MSIWFALVLIVCCAILWDVGIVLQKLAVDEIPQIKLNRSLVSLLKSRRWMGGLIASALGWGFFVFALTFTPVSVARAIQGSGFVVLAVFSLLFLRHRLTVREWIGVVLVTAGIVALGIADSTQSSARIELSLGRLLPALAVCLVICAVALLLPRIRRIGVPRVIAFSIFAGTFLGLGDVSTKILTEVLGRSGFGLGAVGAAVALVIFYASGFVVLSRAYQHGRAVLVTAVSDLCSRLVAILVGIAALGEALAGDPRLRLLALLGYATIIVGAIFLSRFSGSELAEGLHKTPSIAADAGSEGLRHPDEGKHAEGSKADAHR